MADINKVYDLIGKIAVVDGTPYTIVDPTVTPESTNPVQSKGIYEFVLNELTHAVDGEAREEIANIMIEVNNLDQKIDSKMEFYKIDYAAGSLSHDGVNLTYAEIINKYNDPKYFVYVEGEGYTYIPTLPPLEGDEIIEFSSTYLYGGHAYTSRVIINSNNEIKHEEIRLLRADEAPEGGVTKAYVDTQDAALQSQIDNELAEIRQLDTRVTTLENTPIPEQTVANAVNNYVEQHSGGFATESDLLKLQNAVAEVGYSKTIQPYSIINGKRVSISDTYGTIAGVAESSSSIMIFEVTQGLKYRVHGFGYDRDSFYFAGISSTDLTSTGTTLQKILCGGSAYPTDYTYHTIDFVAQSSGYLCVTYKTAQESAFLLTEEFKPITPLDYSRTLIKKGDEYNYLCRIYGDIFASRTFKHCNANNLFQLYKIGYGTFDGVTYIEQSNVMTAYTDIVGPVSIGRYNSSSGFESGLWSGGNHTITRSGVVCKTAQEVSFKAYCNGIDITNANDGLYFGRVTFYTVNDLYFPQTITSDDLTNATKAITESRIYTLDNEMNVKVALDMLYDDVGIAAYYGMQLQIPNDVDTIEQGSYERLLHKTDNVTVMFDNPSNYIYLIGSNGWHYDMVLDCVGLQDRRNVDLTEPYFSQYKYGNVTAGFGKAYQQLVLHKHFAKDTRIMWSGTYKMYHD